MNLQLMRTTAVCLLWLCAGASLAAQGGIGGVLGGNNPKPKPSKPSQMPPATPAAPTLEERAAAAAGELEQQISSLEASLGSRQPRRLKDLDEARNRTATLRQKVDRMRRQFYVADPSADSGVAQKLNALQSHWGDLAKAIVDGRIPDAPLATSRWNAHARSFDQLYCDGRTVPAAAPASGMPLRGWAWACLSDRFFQELSDMEVRVGRGLDARRAGATAPLERSMSAAETMLADIERLDPVHDFALQRLAALLHDTERIGADLRLQELKAQRDAGTGTASFRWLLDASPVVRRPSRAVKVKVTLQGATTEAAVNHAPPPQTGPESRALHKAHFEQAAFDLSRGTPADDRATLARERASALMALATKAR